MIPRTHGRNGRVISAFFLVVALARCDPSERGAKRSLASSSAPTGALPSASARPAASSSAAPPPLAVNRAPTEDDLLIEVPKLTVDSPPAVNEAGSARRDCPLDLAKEDTPREKLERLARSGDPCAKAALVTKLLGGRPSQETFRRALRLAIEAQDSGAGVRDCFLFDFADDGARLATCAERSGNALLLSLLHVSGYGVPRDLERAAAFLEKEETRACGYDQIKAIIAYERAHPTKNRYVYCRDGACTDVEWERCYAERNRRYDWKSSALRAKLAQAASAHRQDYERLLALFDHFVERDSKRVYSRGLFAKRKAANQELALKRRFDALLERVLIEKKLPDATDEEIAALQKNLHEHHALFLKGTLPYHSPADARPTVAYISADQAYQELEQRFVGFSTKALGKDRASAARAALLRLRAETIEAESQP